MSTQVKPEELRPANAQAIDDVTLLILQEDASQNLVNTETQLAHVVLSIFSKILEHLAYLTQGFGPWGASVRINDHLLACAAPSKKYPRVQLTHEKLASLAGTTREVTTHRLNRLEKQGIIQTQPGEIKLLHTAA